MMDTLKQLHTELEARSGAVITFEEVPPEIEEHLLRRVMQLPDHGDLESRSPLIEQRGSR